MAMADLNNLAPDEMDSMMDQVRDAAGFLKALAHEGRLMMLCHLVSGEKTVTEFEKLLSMRQPAVSQQLMRLRSDGLVTARREGKAIYYAIADPRVAQVVSTLHEMFCPDKD
jgi:ArsR family transcriptional regulator